MSIQLYRSWLPGGQAVVTAVLACDDCNALSTIAAGVPDGDSLLSVRARLRIRGRMHAAWGAISGFDRESGRWTVCDLCPSCRRRRTSRKSRPWRRWS